MFISIARWFFPSVRGKIFIPGAIGTGYRTEKRFPYAKSPSLHKLGMVRTPTRTGTSGPSPKRKRSSGGRDLFRPSGISEKGKDNIERIVSFIKSCPRISDYREEEVHLNLACPPPSRGGLES